MMLLLREEQDAHLDTVHPSVFISGSNDHLTSTNTIKTGVDAQHHRYHFAII